MSLANRIESLVERVAQEFNDVRQKSGNLANLQTANKTSLVAAINELKTALVTVGAIDDTQVTTTSSYSSAKIVALLDALPPHAALWLVGDADQLSPVGPGSALQDLVQAFEARDASPLVRLHHSFRAEAELSAVNTALSQGDGVALAEAIDGSQGTVRVFSTTTQDPHRACTQTAAAR